MGEDRGEASPNREAHTPGGGEKRTGSGEFYHTVNTDGSVETHYSVSTVGGNIGGKHYPTKQPHASGGDRKIQRSMIIRGTRFRMSNNLWNPMFRCLYICIMATYSITKWLQCECMA